MCYRDDMLGAYFDFTVATFTAQTIAHRTHRAYTHTFSQYWFSVAVIYHKTWGWVLSHFLLLSLFPSLFPSFPGVIPPFNPSL